MALILFAPLQSCASSDNKSVTGQNLPQENLNENLDENAVFPHHSPLGKGVGVCPGRVVWSWDRKSVDWDGNGYWWELDHFNEASVQRLDLKSTRLNSSHKVQSRMPSSA